MEIGIAEVDPLLRGDTDLTLSVEHDADSTRVNNFNITGDAISASGQGTYADDGATANLEARITDLGLIDTQLSGPAALLADIVTDADGNITLDTTLTAPQAQLDIDGVARPIEGGYDLTSDSRLVARDLSTYAELSLSLIHI